VLIDWFTVIAQIVNFLILAVLIKYLLYDRIVSAMERRQEKFAQREKKAQESFDDSEKRKNEYEEKLRDIEGKRQDILDEAKDQAKNEKKKLLKEAKKEAKSVRKDLLNALQKEKEDIFEEIRRGILKHSKELIARAVRALTDSDIQEKISSVFTEKVASLDKRAKKQIIDSLDEVDYKATVESPHELSNTAKQKITGSLRENLSDRLDLEYRTNKDIILGLSLKTDSYKLAWTLNQHLSDLEESISEQFKKEAKDNGNGKNGSDSKDKR
jgi:F-type H+-transporting ATPase subunit b